MGNVGSAPFAEDPTICLSRRRSDMEVTSAVVSIGCSPQYVFDVYPTHVAAYPTGSQPMLLLSTGSRTEEGLITTQVLPRLAPMPCFVRGKGADVRVTFDLRLASEASLSHLMFICAEDHETYERILVKGKLEIHEDKNVYPVEGSVADRVERFTWVWNWPFPTTTCTYYERLGVRGWICYCAFVAYSLEDNGLVPVCEFQIFTADKDTEGYNFNVNKYAVQHGRSLSFASWHGLEGPLQPTVFEKPLPGMDNASPCLPFRSGSTKSPEEAAVGSLADSKASAADASGQSPVSPSCPSSAESAPQSATPSLVSPTETSSKLASGPPGGGAAIAAAYESTMEDGPLFRALIQSHEKKTQSFKSGLKRVLKALHGLLDARRDKQAAEAALMEELKAFSPAMPVMSAYLDQASEKMAALDETLSRQLDVLLAEPLHKMYDNDIKVAEAKRKEFEAESEAFYKYMSKYLSMKNDSAVNKPDKVRKKLESDSKYMMRRNSFDLVRFDYASYLSELHGGAKDQEIVYHLANYCEKLHQHHVALASVLGDLRPNLDQLRTKMSVKSKEFYSQKKDRLEKRRVLERRASSAAALPLPGAESTAALPAFKAAVSAASTAGCLAEDNGADVGDGSKGDRQAMTFAGSGKSGGGPSSKFRGIRDLDKLSFAGAGRRKEGFLFATSRPRTHVGHGGGVEMVSKTSWHKYWCVLSAGTLREYSNWKRQVESHNEPINLRFATCREARNSGRRFCFEVITPVFTRLYQATSADEMNSWIACINNAIEGLLNGSKSTDFSIYREVGSVPNSPTAAKECQEHEARWWADGRRLSEDESVSLLEILRADPSNHLCAECGASWPDWCVINLGAVVCIECSGIHRSMGTHISKVRSLTLDTASFTRDLLVLLRSIGNATSNAIWEARLSPPHSGTATPKPSKSDPRDVKARFITAKYVDRAFVDRSPLEDLPVVTCTQQPATVQTTEAGLQSARPARRPTATDLLWAAVANEDVVEMLRAISLGADVNSRSPHSSIMAMKNVPTCSIPLQLALMLPTFEPRSPSIASLVEEEEETPAKCELLSPDELELGGMYSPSMPFSAALSDDNGNVVQDPTKARGDAQASCAPGLANLNVDDDMHPQPMVAETSAPFSPAALATQSDSVKPSYGTPNSPGRTSPPPLLGHHSALSMARACSRTYFPMAELLILNGADQLAVVDLATGATTLHFACQSDLREATYYLLTKIGDPHSAKLPYDISGRTPSELGCAGVFEQYAVACEADRRRKADEGGREGRKAKEKSAADVPEEWTHAAPLAALAKRSPPGRAARKFFGSRDAEKRASKE